MADTKISDLTSLAASAVATGDLLPLVDVSDTAMAASGSTRKATVASVRGLLWSLTSDVTINTSGEQSMLGGSYTIPAGYLAAGRLVEVAVAGYLSTPGSSAGTVDWRFKVGSTALCLSPGQAVPTGFTNRAFHFRFLLSCQTTGASGTVRGRDLGSRVHNALVLYQSETGAATVDTTGTLALDATAQFSNSSNTLVITQAYLHALN